MGCMCSGGDTKSVTARAGGADYRYQPPSDAFATNAVSTIPGTVIIFSGCKDTQTSADVSNVSSFGLPPVSPEEKAGGACTNGLLSSLANTPTTPSYGGLLLQMQRVLREKSYTQVPQLSASHQMDLSQVPFSIMNPRSNGRTRALLVGINYLGKPGELSGCVNDVRMMEDFIRRRGYSSDAQDMRILTDEPPYGIGLPTRSNIIAGLKWLVSGAQAGDSLFVHYSGHGLSVRDTSGDESDGKDEALAPLDYDTAGIILDDDLFTLLVADLPRDVTLVGVFDCCHSGTIVDLPFIFSGTAENAAKLESGETMVMGMNSGFSFQNAFKLLGAAVQDPQQREQLMQLASSFLANMQH